ncbi:hypothetical protein FQN57_000958 [Myotisia sp. PD_48]|nr:hypothetical protein FQN57_000958 [Myotisia sp. PD_48]
MNKNLDCFRDGRNIGQPHIGGFGGAGSQASGSGSQVTQIVLEGPNLTTAWRENSLVRSWHPPTNFSPTQTGGPMVFHGSSANTQQAIDDLCTNQLRLGAGNRNEMAPMSVFHTSFYGLRSFLWAVFGANIATPLPLLSTASSALSRQFQFQGVTYQGILLLVYSTTNPHPPVMSSAVLTKPVMRQWISNCTRDFNNRPEKEFIDNYWIRMKGLHGENTKEWPDILHAPEGPETMLAVHDFLGTIATACYRKQARFGKGRTVQKPLLLTSD